MSTSGSSNVQGVDATPAQLAAHTEQALVEMVYVQTANDMLGSALANLDSALNTTQSILNILQGLQNLHNEVTVHAKSAFSFNFKFGNSALLKSNLSGGVTIPTGVTTHTFFGFPQATAGKGLRATIHFSASITAYEQAYNKAASAYFGKAIDPVFAFSSPNAAGYSDYVNTLRSLKTKLANEIAVLTQQTPVAARSDPTSLLGTLKKVLNELPANFQFTTVEKWALDNYNVHGSTGNSLGGNIQNDITFAITAAQSLNDTQKEKVRRYLFIFQEYYQSAAAILSKITQIVEQMAQKISQ